MKTKDPIKESIKLKHQQIANQSLEENCSCCCGSIDPCGTEDYTVFSDDYSNIKGYESDADLGLGCGLPTEFAKIKEGDTVLDLGSGAGNDCFVARRAVGKNGKVIGLDFTESMIERAKFNTEKLGFDNIEFRLGEIEDIPINSNSIDVVISNCVMNLVPNKTKAFDETFRILKNTGHFSISDVVLRGKLPERFVKDAELWAGCVSGALQIDDYIKKIENAGFKNITIQTEKEMILPDEYLLRNFPKDEIESFKKSNTGIFSITVYAEKRT